MMMCKPRCPESFDQMILQNCIIPTTGNSHSRRKITGRYNLLSPSGDFTGRRCPPASPASTLNPNRKQRKKQSTEKKKKNKKTEKKRRDGFNKFEKPHLRKSSFSLSSSNETDLGDWFSSDDEREDEDHEETETLFSSSFKSLSFSSKSISLSSDSEPCDPTRTRARRRRRRRRMRSGRRKEGSASMSGSGRVDPEKVKDVGLVPLQGKVKDTFAVVKSSSDPYNDFRTSMVEMIIEKQIFGAKELEQLLQCFLSLNSPHHHRVIVEVFTEIWDALFSYCS